VSKPNASGHVFVYGGIFVDFLDPDHDTKSTIITTEAGSLVSRKASLFKVKSRKAPLLY